MILYYSWFRKFTSIRIIIIIVFTLVLLIRLQSDKYTGTLPSIPLDFALNNQNLQRENEVLVDSGQISINVACLSCMVVLKASEGRLGNLMFKLASAYGIARIHGCSLYMDKTMTANLTSVFDFEILNQMNERTYNTCVTHHTPTQRHSDCNFFPDLLTPGTVSYLELRGYWQAYGHFLNYMDELRYQFTFSGNIIDSIAPFLKKHISDEHDYITRTGFQNLKKYINTQSTVRWIGIHIRRGDFLSNESTSFGHTISSISYINRAIDYFNHRYLNRTIFFVSSDDKEYCERLFHEKPDVHITPKYYSAAEDLAVLSLCHDTIVTGGTFGWWAGILAGGTIVHDAEYPKKGSRLEALCPKAVYFPPWFLFM